MRTLRGRLVLSSLLVALVALGATGAAFLYSLSPVFDTVARDLALPTVTQVSEVLLDQVEQGASPDAIVAELPRSFPNVSFRYSQASRWSGPPTGVVVVTEEPRTGERSIQLGEAPTALPMQVLRKGDDVRFFLPVVDRRGYVQGILEVRPATPLSYMLRQVNRSLILAAAAGGALALAMAWLLSRQVTRPVHQLGAAAARLAQGHLSERAPGGGPQELADLAQQFNTMAGHLDASFDALEQERDRLRRFAGDASHELKTPLAALRAFLDLLESAPAADRAELLADARRQVDRLDRLTRQLLELTRLEAAGQSLRLAPGDLRAPVNCAVTAARPQAGARSIALAVDLPLDPVLVEMDAPRLEQVVANLLENALKFTPPGGRVQVTLASAAPGQARLTVQDTGPGIPPEDLPRVFERFFRGTHTQAVEGSGLGLSIVQAVVAAHGGEVRAASPPEGGARFDVLLPLQPR